MENIQSPTSSLGQSIFVSSMLDLHYWLLYLIKGTISLEFEMSFVQSPVPISGEILLIVPQFYSQSVPILHYAPRIIQSYSIFVPM